MPNPVKTLNGEKLHVKIGDGATPTETFTHDCMINTDRGIAFSADLTEILVPDCDDQSLPGWKQILKDGLSATINGAGRLHTQSLETWSNWMVNDVAKNVRVETNGVTGANGGGYWAGAFKVVNFSLNGPRKNLTDVEIEMRSHGPVVWVDLP